ncbi:MAG: hypothetical protein MUP71_11620 [Candidatus Aminicenantes bacterium]|nr:hypothetical protein [Candidatus Aminicenantes bacterium]
MDSRNRIGFPPLITLTGLYKKTDRNGREFLSGELGNSKIFVFPNENKKFTGQPDFFLSLGQRILPDDWKKSKGKDNGKMTIEVVHTYQSGDSKNKNGDHDSHHN